MKESKLIAIAGALLCLAGIPCHAAEEAPTAEEEVIAAEVQKMFEVTSAATKVESEEVKKVTDAAIYDVKVMIKGPESTSTSTVRVLKSGDDITAFERPSTNQACPVLQSMIKEGFKLKTEEDIQTLEAVLDKLYPISDGFGDKDLKAKTTRKSDGRVVFVRGEFFKKRKGFIFEIDETGTIQKVTYSLKLELELE